MSHQYAWSGNEINAIVNYLKAEEVNCYAYCKCYEHDSVGLTWAYTNIALQLWAMFFLTFGLSPLGAAGPFATARSVGGAVVISLCLRVSHLYFILKQQ